MTSSTDNKRSRYVQGGTTDIQPKRLGWWERKIMVRTNTDINFPVTGKFVNRPDLIAKEVYGSDMYMWLVLQYNTILDPEAELTEGTFIVLPSPERIL